MIKDLLAIPLVLEAETVRLGDGGYVRRLRYPDLSGCAVEGDDIDVLVDAIEALRAQRLAGLSPTERVDLLSRPRLSTGPLLLARDALTPGWARSDPGSEEEQ